MKTKFYPFLSIFFLIFIFSACQKELSVDNEILPPVNSGSAKFTLDGSPVNCASPVITGTFEAGIAANLTNTITVKVNVTDTGNYSVTSTGVNGLQFVATGLFVATGPQTILFHATGTPTIGGNFAVKLISNGCSVDITVTGAVTLPPVNNSDCKSCAYIPMCVGSKYEYNDTTMGSASIRKIEYLSTKDTTINGKPYKKIRELSGDGYYNCTNGETTVFTYSSTSAGGTTIQNIKLTPLKANSIVGTTWTDEIVNQLGQTVSQIFTIASKGSRIAGGVNYPDVIKVKLETGIDFPPFGFITAGISYYYYAKGIGLIESVTEDPNTNTIIYHSVLRTYFIP